MMQETDPMAEKVKAQTEEETSSSKGFLQRASAFIARHMQRGERLLQWEKLEQEYELDGYMDQYRQAFEYEADFQQARSHVMDRLIDEYLPAIPDRERFTFRSEYLEKVVDSLFEEELAHYEKSKRLKDLYQVGKDGH